MMNAQPFPTSVMPTPLVSSMAVASTSSPTPTGTLSPADLQPFIPAEGITGPVHAARMAEEAWKQASAVPPGPQRDALTRATQFFAKLATDASFAQSLAKLDAKSGDGGTISLKDLGFLAKGKAFLALADIGPVPRLTPELEQQLKALGSMTSPEMVSSFDAGSRVQMPNLGEMPNPGGMPNLGGMPNHLGGMANHLGGMPNLGEMPNPGGMPNLGGMANHLGGMPNHLGGIQPTVLPPIYIQQPSAPVIQPIIIQQPPAQIQQMIIQQSVAMPNFNPSFQTNPLFSQQRDGLTGMSVVPGMAPNTSPLQNPLGNLGTVGNMGMMLQPMQFNATIMLQPQMLRMM